MTHQGAPIISAMRCYSINTNIALSQQFITVEDIYNHGFIETGIGVNVLLT